MAQLETKSTVNSAGEPGLKMRPGARIYNIPEVPIRSPDDLLSEHLKVQEAMEIALDQRRGIVRTRTDLPTMARLSEEPSFMRLEAALPLGNTGDFIVTYASNRYAVDPVKIENQAQQNFVTKPLEELSLPSSKIERVDKEGYYVSNRLTPADTEDLMRLWWVFGWTWKGIDQFIEEYNTSPDSPWFSAVRDKTTGKLVGAVQGDKVEYADHMSVEVTEFGTLPNFEGKGICTAALSGLITQIVEDTLSQSRNVSDKNPDNLPVLIYSELNIDSTSFLVAQSLGFASPQISLDGQSYIDQTLRENIFVLERTPEMEELWMSLTSEQQEELLTKPDFYQAHLRNFVMMHLPTEVIERRFDAGERNRILKFYNNFN